MCMVRGGCGWMVEGEVGRVEVRVGCGGCG